MKEKDKNKTKQNKDSEEQGGPEAIVKGWELNDLLCI